VAVTVMVGVNHTPGASAQGATGSRNLPGVGAVAPTFELTSLEGQLLRLEAYRGQPFVLNFFASWCDPCRDEMPLLNELAASASRDGYRVVGVAIQDTRPALLQYATEAGLTFPIALDLNNKVQRAYWVYAPPATFFIDAQGVIRDKVSGPLSPERARAALAHIGIRR
jgi:cytochrome c biogenesis protein CcmG/thiol:disulfide interchange protein DsbE